MGRMVAGTETGEITRVGRMNPLKISGLGIGDFYWVIGYWIE
jgi:hypothetical protein